MTQEEVGSNRIPVSLHAGDLTIHLGKREVRRNGVAIELPKLSFQLLYVLVESAPNLVSIDKLIERVWSGRVVSPETVTQRIKLLRNALGDDAQNPRYIGLVRGEGYRLLVDVEPSRATDISLAPDSGDKRSFLLPLLATLSCIGVLVAVLAITSFDGSSVNSPGTRDSNSVAVLPVVSRGDEEHEYLSNGLGDELRDQLGRIAGLRVAARSSSMVFEDRAMDAKQIAAQLGVRWLIETTTRSQGDHLRVSIQIIDGETGFQSWSESFDHLQSDILGVQQDIAMQVVTQILPDSTQDVAGAYPGPRDVSAHTLMLLARHTEHKVRDNALLDPVLLDRAIELYSQVIGIEPDNALAYSRLASVLLYRGSLAEAEPLIEEALALDPGLSEAHYSNGLLLWQRRDSAAGEAFHRALTLNPNNADALAAYGQWLWNGYDSTTPERYLREALLIDPLTLQRYIDLGNFYGLTGTREPGLEIAGKVEQLFPNVTGYRALGRIYEVLGDFDQAIYWTRKALEAEPAVPDASWQLSELYARIGDDEHAIQLNVETNVAFLFHSRRYAELIDVGEELLIEYPDDMQLYHLLSFAYLAEGYFAEAARLLELAGYPGIVLERHGRAADAEAMATYIGALQAMDRQAEAEQYTRWLLSSVLGSYTTGDPRGWWASLFVACAYGYAGDDKSMYQYLDNVSSGTGLVWYPWLMDLHCFQAFNNDGRYLGIVSAVEKRMAGQREKVQARLAGSRLE